MKQKSNLTPLQKYYRKCTITYLIFIALWITMYLLIRNSLPLLAILFFISAYFLILTVRIIARRTLLYVIYVDFDAIEFQKIIKSKKFIPPVDYLIVGNIAIGDYQTAINIATHKLSNKKSSRAWKYYCLYHLAVIYFDLRDFEKLRSILDKFDEYDKNYGSKRRFKAYKKPFELFKLFLDSDYDGIKYMCTQNKASLNPKNYISKYRLLWSDFYYAIACYYNNETEEAEKIFETIIESAPKLNFSDISKDYLEAINNGVELKSNVEIIPKSVHQLYTDAQNKKRRILRITKIIYIVALCIFICVTKYVDKKQYERSVYEFEQNLNDAIDNYYFQGEFINYFRIKYDEENYETLCIVDAQNRIDLVSVVTFDGETTDIIELKERIKIGKYHYAKSAVSDYYIGFTVYDKEQNPDDFYYVVNFTYDNEEYWLAIDYIETTLNG